MMTTTTTDTATLAASDTAVILRTRLGDLRAWPDFLADNIRHKQNICGHRLMPCGRRRIRGCLRPIYAVQDVKEFIAKVLASVPDAGKAPIKTTVLKIDRRRHWRLNKFDETGAPIPPSSSASAHHASA